MTLVPRSSWYAIRTKLKQEHICARMLRSRLRLEVFCPRISYKKKTARGDVRFIEALFPTYIFVMCNLSECYDRLVVTQGVRGLVSCGGVYPEIPGRVIEVIRQEMQGEVLIVDPAQLEPGADVRILEGPFIDCRAIVKDHQSAEGRVRVMLEFLGNLTEVTVSARHVRRVGT